MNRLPALALLLLSLSAAAQTPETVTLAQCRQWAHERSESLKIGRESVVQAGERARTSLGGALPRLDFDLTKTWQEPAGVERLEAKGYAGFVQKQQTESKFTLKQPLFSGLKEWSALKGFRREQARDALRVTRATSELDDAVAGAFYEVLRDESDRTNAQATLTLADDRTKELSGFLKLGKARDSEVFTSKAHTAAIRADLRRIESRLSLAREDLSFLTGRDLAAAALDDGLAAPAAPGPLDAALARAKDRADLRAQREDLEARRLKVRYEKGGHSPWADVTGTYYTQRPAFMKDIKWDVALGLHLPIFQGGSTSARVREAESGVRQSELALLELERRVEHAVRRTHGELSASIEEGKSLEEAAAAAEQSYKSLLEEYKIGLVTNLEVLQALDLLQAQRSARDAARFQAKRLLFALQAAIEDAP